MQKDMSEIEVFEKTVACKGDAEGSSDGGHPLVYLKIGSDGTAECPYCDRIYRYKARKRA
ncbi:MAG: zinc-finger domain-containing protein [Alphaproteobacteria bacterium]